MTVSFSTRETRRREIVHLANALLRHRFGLQPRSTRIEGPGFAAKAVLQKLLRDSAWVKQQRAARRAVAFKLQTPQQKMAAE